MRELDAYELGLHGCGYHRDLLDDKSNVFTPETWTCPVCQGVDQFARRLQKGDEQHRKTRGENGPDPAAGRGIYMRLMTPAQAEAWRQRQRQSVAEQSPREQDKPADTADDGGQDGD